MLLLSLLLAAALLAIGCAQEHSEFVPPITAATPVTTERRLSSDSVSTSRGAQLQKEEISEITFRSPNSQRTGQPADRARQVSQQSLDGPSVLTGTFDGLIAGLERGSVFSTHVTFILVETTGRVRGSWRSTEGKSGRLTGTLAPESITALHLEQLKPCLGIYHGVATIVENGSKLRGSYVGADCHGKADASFVVTRP